MFLNYLGNKQLESFKLEFTIATQVLETWVLSVGRVELEFHKLELLELEFFRLEFPKERNSTSTQRETKLNFNLERNEITSTSTDLEKNDINKPKQTQRPTTKQTNPFQLQLQQQSLDTHRNHEPQRSNPRRNEDQTQTTKKKQRRSNPNNKDQTMTMKATEPRWWRLHATKAPTVAAKASFSFLLWVFGFVNVPSFSSLGLWVCLSFIASLWV